ncbi:MAG: hypothetical protein SWK76_16550 [Actinomycetota bacterium]|nr:hypothetical protein [Actinomycetota bacterium]
MQTSELIGKVRRWAEETITLEFVSFLLDPQKQEIALLEFWIRGRVVKGVHLSLDLDNDILAAGAPAALFLHPVANRLACARITLTHIEVANAVGAVAGVVSHCEEVVIRRQPESPDRAFASNGCYDHANLASAINTALDMARKIAVDMARASGAGESRRYRGERISG